MRTEELIGNIATTQGINGNASTSTTVFIEPNMEIGSVETTEEAEASITGTRPNFVLNLGIPKGEKGDRGERGLRGETGERGADGYTPVKGVDYFDGKNGIDGKTPVKGVDYFDGKDGATGKDGVTPTLKVGSTTTGAAGTNANVTMSQNGTTYTLDFTIPKGDKGEAGSGGGDVDLSNYYTKTEIDDKKYITNNITTDFNLDGKVYLNTVGTSVNSNDSSRIVFGTSSKAYSWIASNTSGAFSFSKGDGNILIYPKTGTYNCIMTDCESDIGRTDKKWKNLYMSGSIINGSFSIPVSKIANTDNYYTKSEIDAMLVNGDEVSY